MKGLVLAFALLLSAISGIAKAQDGGDGSFACPDSEFLGAAFFNNVCWSCIFPLRVMGVNLGPADGSSSYGDSGVGNMLPDIFGSGNSTRIPSGTAAPICVCPGKIGYPSPGITWGYWEPSHLTEVVRKPYCSPLFGTTLMKDSGGSMPGGGGDAAAGQQAMKMIRWGGPNNASDTTSENLGQSFYHYHWLKSPYGYVSDWIQSALCSGGGGGDMDFLWLSEIDPVWTKEKLANLTHPEAKLFANPVAQLACMADAVTSTIGKPTELLFWCAGSWGAIYPHMGYLGYEASPPRETSLMATRVMAQMHRRGLAKKRYGNQSVCSARMYFTLPKQGYRFQTFYPMRETKNNHWIGASTFRWGEWRNIPYSGEDYVYLMSSFSECCATFY